MAITSGLSLANLANYFARRLTSDHGLIIIYLSARGLKAPAGTAWAWGPLGSMAATVPAQVQVFSGRTGLLPRPLPTSAPAHSPTCLESAQPDPGLATGPGFQSWSADMALPSSAPILTRAWNPMPLPSSPKLPEKRSHRRQGWTGPLSIRSRVGPASWQARTDERRKGQGRPGTPRGPNQGRRTTFVDRLESVPWLKAVLASGPVASSLAQHHRYTPKMIATLAIGVG